MSSSFVPRLSPGIYGGLTADDISMPENVSYETKCMLSGDFYAVGDPNYNPDMIRESYKEAVFEQIMSLKEKTMAHFMIHGMTVVIIRTENISAGCASGYLTRSFTVNEDSDGKGILMIIPVKYTNFNVQPADEREFKDGVFFFKNIIDHKFHYLFGTDSGFDYPTVELCNELGCIIVKAQQNQPDYFMYRQKHPYSNRMLPAYDFSKTGAALKKHRKDLFMDDLSFEIKDSNGKKLMISGNRAIAIPFKAMDYNLRIYHLTKADRRFLTIVDKCLGYSADLYLDCVREQLEGMPRSFKAEVDISNDKPMKSFIACKNACAKVTLYFKQKNQHETADTNTPYIPTAADIAAWSR